MGRNRLAQKARNFGALLWLAFLPVWVATIGIAAWDRWFAKLHLGPLFALEAAFALWLAAALLIRWKAVADALKASLPLLVFSSWGAILAAFDLLTARSHPEFSAFRFAQHCLLFAYPLMWVPAGQWFYRTQKPLAETLMLSVFAVNTLQVVLTGAWLANWHKTSLGPLIVPYFLWELYGLLSDRKARKPKKLAWVALLALVSLLPFWEAWFISQIRRTSVAILLSLLFITPWLVPKRRPLVAMSTSALALLTLGLGLGAATALKHGDLDPIGSHFMETMQHGDDLHPHLGDQPFKARVRRFMWNQAIEDWKRRPLTGIGFVPEVPSYVFEDRKNDGGFGSEGTPPVSGPHNSYLSVLTRMGIPGILAFLAMAGLWLAGVPRIMAVKTSPLARILMVFVPFNGAIYALFNVGFESPHNAFLFWLFVGFGLACAKEKAET